MQADLKARYDLELAHDYDRGSPAFVYNWKRMAFADAGLKQGDRVVVFCCGTGRDFPLIREHIGESGHILGLDFSQGMLDRAAAIIAANKWHNIELRHTDVVAMDYLGEQFDAAVCTLGLSTIPDADKAYANIKRHVKPGGKIIIGDYQLATGWRAFFNPVIISFCRKFGGSRENHKKSRNIFLRMHQELGGIRERQFLFNTYRYCIGERIGEAKDRREAP